MNDYKCLIIHTPRLHYEEGKITSDINYSAMGLFSLAGEMIKKGFETKILHLGIEKYLNKEFFLSSYIKENNIKMVAFSLQWNQSCFDVIETAKFVKDRCPDVFIVLGGYTASFFSLEILNNFYFIDAVIKGEGEEAMPLLAESLYSNLPFDKVPNLHWRKKRKIILNNRFFVANSDDLSKYDFFNPKNMLHYSEYSRIPMVLEYSKENQLNNPSTTQGLCLGRGCLGNCVWCGGGFSAEKKVSFRNFISYRNPDVVIEDIKRMKNDYNVDYFRFSFDPNPNDRSYLINLFNKMQNNFKEKLNLVYNIDGLPDKELLKAFKNAASDNSVMLMSPVCFDEELRKKYKSFFYTNKQLEEILSYMDELKIKSEIYFSDIPGVDISINEESFEFGKYIKNKYNCVIDVYNYDMIFVPAAPWGYNPEKYNLKNYPATFMDYYLLNKSFEGSFEKSFSNIDN